MYYYPVPAPYYVQGPVPIFGLCAPPTQRYVGVTHPPSPPSVLKNKERKESDDDAKDKKANDKNKDNTDHSENSKKEKDIKEKKAESKQSNKVETNLAAPPPVRHGMNYMFPTEHTSVHMFDFPRKVWEEKYEGKQQGFKQYQVDTQKTVKALIEFVMQWRVKGDFSKCKGWAATEVIEVGDGKWKKGTTIEYGSDKAKGTLASMGWSTKRGESLPPVWITVHKA